MLRARRHGPDSRWTSWVSAVHFRSGDEDIDDNIEDGLIDNLASLEEKGYVERVDETHDLRRDPLYRVTPEGTQAALER